MATRIRRVIAAALTALTLSVAVAAPVAVGSPAPAHVTRDIPVGCC